MSVVWVIEPSHQSEETIASVLMGDFAVRVFGSSASFRRLHKSAQQRMPDAIVVKVQSGVCDQNEIEALLVANYTTVPRALLVDAVGEPYCLKSGVWIYPRKFDPISLSKFIKGLVKFENSSNGRCLRFKDLVFDIEQFSLIIEPEADGQAIPPKEAKILRMLMKSAGKPISRHDISESLWEGMKVSSRILDSHISRLRRRLERSESSIESIYGGGYILK